MSAQLILYVLLGAIAAATAPFTPVSWRLGASLILSIFQLYLIPVGTVTFSLWLASTYLLWPELTKEIRNLARMPAIRTLMMLMLLQIISWAWSPDVVAGFRHLVYTIPFLLLVAASFNMAKKTPAELLKLLKAVPVCMLVEAFLVVLFRLDPESKWRYFNSSLAGLFSGPNTVKQFLVQMGVTNNYLALGKAGGFLVNGNVAAAYLGIGAMTAYFLAKERQSLSFRVITVILWVSIFFTGSKSGDILAVIVPLAMSYLPHLARERGTRRVLKLLFVIGFAAIVGYEVVRSYWSELISTWFVRHTIETTGYRLVIWAYGFHEFLQRPFLGLGFGGWTAGFASYAHLVHVSAKLPPQNTLIRLWARSGLFAALLGLIFMIQVVRHAIELSEHKNDAIKASGLVLFAVALWVFAHGMGSNSGLLGDVHELPLLASLVGLSYAVDSRAELIKKAALAFALA